MADTPLPATLVRREVGRFLHRQDHGGQALAYVYFERGRRAAAHRLRRRGAASSARSAACRKMSGDEPVRVLVACLVMAAETAIAAGQAMTQAPAEKERSPTISSALN